MPLSIDEAAAANASAARAKAVMYRDIPKAFVSSLLAGGYVGLAIVLLISVSAPLAAAGHPLTKLVQGSAFGLALTLVVFAGAELFTGNTMVMTQGRLAGEVRSRDLGVVWLVSLVGNVVGSIGLAAMVYGGGAVTGPVAELIDKTIASKNALDGGQLFWRAVLCNALVCLALWMAARATSDGAKLAVLWWALLAFIGSGYEHSIANVTTFALGALDGSASWGDLGRNLVWTVPGNAVGGALVVGACYSWLGGVRSAATARAARAGRGGVERGPVGAAAAGLPLATVE